MKKTLAILFIVMSMTAYAQKYKLVQGSLKPLKGQASIVTEFTYDNMQIGKDGKLSEADYIKRKKEEYNAKEAGRGEKWEAAWYADRKERFEPQFKELFERYAKMKPVASDAKYTLIFKTTKTEPGWNVAVMRQPARIDAEVWIVETADPSNLIAKIVITGAPGRDAAGYDFDTGYRIQEAYAKSGKEVGKLITD
jgi:hypothetical protein